MTTAPYISPAQAALLRKMERMGVYWRLDLAPRPTDPPGTLDQTLRFWNGFNDAPQGIDSVDIDTNQIYRGLGAIKEVPVVDALINGKSDRIEFALSGLVKTVAKQIDEAGIDVRGREVHLGVAPLDLYYQPTTSIVSLWYGNADFWVARLPETKREDESHLLTIALSVGSGMIGRSRPRKVTFSDAQQRIDHPDDEGFVRVTRYTQTYSVTWPRF